MFLCRIPIIYHHRRPDPAEEFANNKKDGGRLLKEKSITQDLINQKQTQLSKLKFDPERYQPAP
eukprot:5310382-Heterocapsa_arctica.AAC.1